MRTASVLSPQASVRVGRTPWSAADALVGLVVNNVEAAPQ